MPRPADAVYLSPHLDDAVLSCGGQIRERTGRGERVLVVTVFAASPAADHLSPFARKLHELWGLGADPVAERRAEDVAACRQVGAEAVHWDLADALYRAGPDGTPGYPTVRALFGRPRPADLGLAAEIGRRLAGLGPRALLLAPLAVGGHIDHRLVRLAAEREPAAATRFYEDFPYARLRLSSLWARRRGGPWQAETVAISEPALRARIEAIACYRSQVGTLFGGSADIERQVRSHAARVAGERLWRRAAR